MLHAQDRSYTRRDTWMFLVAIGLSVVALFAPPAWGTAVASALRSTVLAPLIWLQERAEEGKTSRARFSALTRERDSVALLAQAVPAVRAENARLRELLGLGRRLGPRYAAAEVLHQPQVTDGRTILLSAGASDGVAPFDPILAPQGLIGVVLSVTANNSVGMTWAHPEFRVSGATSDGGAYGIVSPPVAGVGAGLLELHGVPYRDSVPNGTLVVSSGMGGVYPRGIPIGTVVGIESEQPGWERVYRVRPAASPAEIGHVLILLESDTMVATAFPTDSILRAIAADSARRQAVADSLLRVRIADSVRAADRVAERAAPRDTAR